MSLRQYLRQVLRRTECVCRMAARATVGTRLACDADFAALHYVGCTRAQKVTRVSGFGWIWSGYLYGHILTKVRNFRKDLSIEGV